MSRRLFLCCLCLLTACQPMAPQPRPQPLYPQIAPEEQNRERARLEELFQTSKPLLQRLTLAHRQEITFDQLRHEAAVTADRVHLQESLPATLEWIEWIATQSDRLKPIYGFPHTWQAPLVPRRLLYVQEGNALLTPFQQSMFRHCKTRFRVMTGHSLKLEAGYRSPAFQLYLTAQQEGTWGELAAAGPLPFYSRHQGEEPDLTLSLEHPAKSPAEEADLLAQIPAHCGQFGFFATAPQDPTQQKEFTLFSQWEYYQYLADHPKIPPSLATEMLTGMEMARFYPSEEGLKVLIAMTWKESSFLWNPKLILTKKETMERRFNEVMGLTEGGLAGRLASMILSEELLNHKDRLKKELHRLTRHGDYSISEYDVYLWSRDLYSFALELRKEFSNLASLGALVVDLDKLLLRLEKEPQTFGLWQINVNHLAEAIKALPIWKAKYPRLFPNGLLSRHGLIQSLSGLPKAPLSRVETMALLMETWFAPRYYDHLQGQPGELVYFAAEHFTGRLSTYKAALQQRLTEIEGAKLQADGDFAHSRPYSRKPDLTQQSNSLIALQDYARRQVADSSQRNRMLKELVEVDSLSRLLQTRLYRQIMGNQAGRRVFPQMPDALAQPPKGYAQRVMQIARDY